MASFPRPSLGPAFDPEPKRESMRGWLAIGLLILLSLEIIIALLLLLYSGTKFENIRDILSIVFGGTVTLVGTALGFYFGDKKSSDTS